MDAIHALKTRVSVSRPEMTMPPADVLENIFAAALRAPDHAQLKPWRFLTIQGEARAELGELFASVQAKDKPELDEAALAKIRTKPLRAPLVVVVIASPQVHPKVPEVEQLMSAAAATQNMLLAAHAQDASAIWRTGSMSYHKEVHRGLGLKEHEHLIAYLYIGSCPEKRREPPQMDIEEYFCPWSNQH